MNQRKSFETLIRKCSEYIWKIYPVLYADGADDFDLKRNPTNSACLEPDKLARRQLLI